jgi:hypothetical protein
MGLMFLERSNFRKFVFRLNFNGIYFVLEQRTFFHIDKISRVEAGKNTSIVIPASRKGRRKGNRISLR